MQQYYLKDKKTVANKNCKNYFINQYCHFLSDWDQEKKDWKLGCNTTNQQSLLKFFGEIPKNPLTKNGEDSINFNNNKTSLPTKRVYEDPERMTID